MEAHETAEAIDLPDTRVWVAGDWHGNAGWVGTLLPAMRRVDPTMSTVLHVGDFWASREFCRSVDYWAAEAGIARVLVTLGNHEPWGELGSLVGLQQGRAVRISDTVWVLPRPFRFQIGGRTVLSLGGAASVDCRWRTEGRDWWPAEAITDGMVRVAVSGGAADVMLTHETPEQTPVEEVRDVLRVNPHEFPPDALAYSAMSRAQIDRVWSAVSPRLLLHGHMHLYGEGTARGTTSDGCRVVSLNRDTFAGNAGVLDLATLDFEPLSLARIRRSWW